MPFNIKTNGNYEEHGMKLLWNILNSVVLYTHVLFVCVIPKGF